jgi:hypothetical protein
MEIPIEYFWYGFKNSLGVYDAQEKTNPFHAI